MSSSFLKRTRRIRPFCSPPHAPPPSALPAQNGWTEVRCGLSGPLCTDGGCFGLFLKIFYFWENGFSYHSHRRDSSVHWKWWLCCTVSNEKKKWLENGLVIYAHFSMRFHTQCTQINMLLERMRAVCGLLSGLGVCNCFFATHFRNKFRSILLTSHL